MDPLDLNNCDPRFPGYPLKEPLFVHVLFQRAQFVRQVFEHALDVFFLFILVGLRLAVEAAPDDDAHPGEIFREFGTAQEPLRGDMSVHRAADQLTQSAGVAL